MSLDTAAVYDLATDILTSVVDRLTGAGIGVPDRRYVHAGEVAFDCEQLVVTIPEAGLTHAFPGESAKVEHCSPPRHVAVEAWLVRCVPSLTDSGDPPTTGALDAFAAVQLADLWALAYVLWAGYDAGEWASTCATVLMGPVTVVGPEGTHGAVKATVYVLIT